MYISQTLKIKKEYKEATYEALKQCGFHLRNKIKGSLKVKNKKNGYEVSKPGEPPKVSKTTSPLRKYVLFNVNKAEGKLVVGVGKWKGFTDINAESFGKSMGRQTVPERLEEGGSATLKTRKFVKTIVLRDFKPNPAKTKFRTISGGRNRGKLPHNRRTGQVIKQAIGQYYFWSRQSWMRARNAPEFLRWCLIHQKLESRIIRMLPRPFVRPAMQQYINEGGLEKDLQYAIERAKKRLALKRSTTFGGLGWLPFFRDEQLKKLPSR